MHSLHMNVIFQQTYIFLQEMHYCPCTYHISTHTHKPTLTDRINVFEWTGFSGLDGVVAGLW